ncbi:MAG: hypothetical protein JHC33_10180 [Ignisphaera sp.]|nr:hypothetical protein [Ignisphaera sp.]
MEIYLDERTFDSHILDNKNGGIIAENFTYLLKNLMLFIDPQFEYKGVKKAKDVAGPVKGVLGAAGNKPGLKGGRRRMERGVREWKLPYNISFISTQVLNAIGEDIDVDVWKISHPLVVDPDLGEKYPTHTGAAKKPRGPYTVKMTARQDIINKKGTRTYVECDCEDFKATFYEELNDRGYTNTQSLPRSTGKRALAPAMCKHIYAIFDKEYRDIVGKAEKWIEDANASLFGGPTGQTSGAPATTPTQLTPFTTNAKVAITKQDALTLVKAELQKIHATFKNNPQAYFDPTPKRTLPYHQYMFFVIQVNKDIRAIAYRNKTLPGLAPKGPYAVLEIPNNPKIWAKFFSKTTSPNVKQAHPDFEILWNMIRELGPMPEKLQKKLEKQLGHEMHMFEDVEYMVDMSLIETKNSSILSSISELS